VPITPLSLAERLRRALGRPVELKVVRTSTTVLRRLPARGAMARVRVHEIFLDAPGNVLDAVVSWIQRPTDSNGHAIDRFVRERGDDIDACRRVPRLRSRGRHRDLRRILDELNQRYFANALRCEITFSRPTAASGRRVRSLQYGVFDPITRVVRIHPVLDLPWIPHFFVEYIVYHEMLHAALPVRADEDGKRRHHTAEFRALERRFLSYRDAVAWEKKSLPKILRAATRVPALPRHPLPRQLDFPFALTPVDTILPRAPR